MADMFTVNPRTSVGPPGSGIEQPGDFWTRFRDLALGGGPGIAEQAKALAAAHEGDDSAGDYLNDPAALELAGAMDFSGAIKAYHGSPHVFDKFDMTKIGTGEGAQAYGHGLYFAESPAVAESYRMGSPMPIVKGEPLHPAVTTKLQASFVHGGGGVDGAKEWLQKQINIQERNLGKTKDAMEQREKAYYLDTSKQALAALERGDVEIGPAPGGLYEVNLHPDHEDLLDWDAPLSQQPEKIRKAIEPLLPSQATTAADDELLAQLLDDSPAADAIASHAETLPAFDPTGQQIYEMLSGKGTNSVFGNSPASKIAAERLRDAGIPGLRYLDAGSRTGGEGSRNIVMFDDSKIDVLSRNGQPLTMFDQPPAAPSMFELPMDQASRMARAKEQGFDVDRPVYHGTTADISGFEARRAPKTEQMGLQGVHVADSPGFAGRYAEGEGGNVHKVVTGGKLLDATALVTEGSQEAQIMGELLKGTGRKPYWSSANYDGSGLKVAPPLQTYIDSVSPKKAEAILKKYGYDGLRYDAKYGELAAGGRGMQVTDKSGAAVVFDPANIRSVHAQFDPAKRNSRDLLASMAATGAAGSGLASMFDPGGT